MLLKQRVLFLDTPFSVVLKENQRKKHILGFLKKGHTVFPKSDSNPGIRAQFEIQTGLPHPLARQWHLPDAAFSLYRKKASNPSICFSPLQKHETMFSSDRFPLKPTGEIKHILNQMEDYPRLRANREPLDPINLTTFLHRPVELSSPTKMIWKN